MSLQAVAMAARTMHGELSIFFLSVTITDFRVIGFRRFWVLKEVINQCSLGVSSKFISIRRKMWIMIICGSD